HPRSRRRACARVGHRRCKAEGASAASSLTAGTQHGRTAVDDVGSEEPPAAAMTRLAAASVDIEACRERAALAGCIAIVAKARPARFDRFAQHADDARVQPLDLVRTYGSARTRWIDPRAPQRFVRVDVAEAGDPALVHHQLFHRL